MTEKKKAIFFTLVVIAALTVLCVYLGNMKHYRVPNYAAPLCVLVTAQVGLHLLKCRNLKLIPLLALLNGPTLFFAFHVIWDLPALAIVMMGICVHTTYVTHWVLKENGNAAVWRIIVFWVVSILLAWVVMSGILLCAWIRSGADHAADFMSAISPMIT